MRLIIYCLILLSVAAQTSYAQGPKPAAGEATKTIQPSHDAAAKPLRNADVLGMTSAQLSPEIIAAKIRASATDFDTSPAALKELKEAGVPEAVLLAMVEAPRASAAGAGPGAEAARPKKTVALKVPAGTRVEVEAAYRVSSQEVRKGDLLTFRVVNPVQVDGVTVVEPGAVATARVEKSSRGGHFGRAGRLVWTMYEVTAVDGTRVQIRADGRQVGDSKGAKVATQMVVMGALIPPAAPLMLLHGFKRGGNAYLPEGKRFDVYVRADATVKAEVAQED